LADPEQAGGYPVFVEQRDDESTKTAPPVVARRLFAAVTPIVLGLVLATTASAAQRYATPTGVHANPCTQALPCDIVTAINDAGANDEVIVEPGSYGSVGTPITTELSVPNLAGINIHGVAGEARPQIYTDANEAIDMGPASTALSDLDIEDSDADALGLFASAGTISDMIVRTTGGDSDACEGSGSLTIVGSVCDGAGPNSIGLDSSGISCDNTDGTQTISNSDFYGTGSGDGLDADLETNCEMTINATNVIARGGTSGEDVGAQGFGGGAVLSLAHSDYVGVLAGSEATITPAGTATNIESDPELVNPAGEDFHETAGSPTINAGLTSVANGTEDFDGQPRTEGGLTDIGADEYLAAPTVTGGPPTGVGAVVATLTGTVNPGHDTTSYTFHYGTTQALGENSATQTLQPGLSAQGVSASISGLAAGTTYYWDIVVTNTVGTNTSTINTLTTVAAPQLSVLTLAPAHFRAAARIASAAKHKAKPKASGTTISYQDSEAATATFVIEQYRAGEERSGRCVAQPAHQKRKPGRPCRRLVALGSFTHLDTAGANRVQFSGRLAGRALAHGSYTITATPSNSFGLTGATRTATFKVKG
jgi:hypothetical protein